MEYIYLGDRQTAPVLKGKPCRAVRLDGKCVRGKNGAMLVEFGNGEGHIIIGRLLRRIDKPQQIARSEASNQFALEHERVPLALLIAMN